jgi:hypothetical protein
MADTLSSDLRDATAGHDQDTAAPPLKKPDNEEPAMVLEADLPSDGRDDVGEAMIRNLPQRPELAEPPSRATHPQP